MHSAIVNSGNVIELLPAQQGHLYIIDVSQSVDLDHPHALDFLREDCVHISVRILYLSLFFPPSPLPSIREMIQFN